MADFCVDNTQQVEFDEKVVCGLWQCEALRASQKPNSDVASDGKEGIITTVVISVVIQTTLIARFMGPIWGLPGADRTQVGSMLAPWPLLSENSTYSQSKDRAPMFTHSCLQSSRVVMAGYLLATWAWVSDTTVKQSSRKGNHQHYGDVLMSAMASQITGTSAVCSTVCSGAGQRKHQSSTSLVFVRGVQRWPVESPRKGK